MNILHPKENGDWIVQRSAVFPTLLPLAGDTSKKFEKHCEQTIFIGYSNGYGTSRDVWVYGYSENSVVSDVKHMIESYNHCVETGTQLFDASKISWSSSLESDYTKRIHLKYYENSVKTASYRPFSKKKMYIGKGMIHRMAQMPRIYPEGGNNLTMCVAGVGVKKDFTCLMTDSHTDVQFMQNGQCFPLYWYDIGAERSTKQSSMMDFGGVAQSLGLVRHDGISDWALQQAVSKYGNGVSKEDIFYYIYGYLHSTDYRSAFSDDLKLSLPRIGFVDDPDDFRKFVEAGRKLADLHLNYESAPPCKEVLINGRTDIESFLRNESLLRVTKMKLDPVARKLVYNEHITIENIPEEAFRYVVNGRSALGWIVDQYQISKDKESGIVNDPNEYAGSAYIFNLVLSVITVSVETMNVVDSLPKLSFSDIDSEERSDKACDCQ